MLYIVIAENLFRQPGTLLERIATHPDGVSYYFDGEKKLFMVDTHCELLGKI